MPKISFVIPNLNNADYLMQCINSVANGNFRDFELLVVDDGSTDGSLEMAQEAAVIDSRIRVIEKPHSGLGPTRNVGIDQSKGEYIAFIDGDDWVDIDSYQTILDSAEYNHADIVFFGYVREDLEMGVSRSVGLESVIGVDPAFLNSQLIADMVGPGNLPSPFKEQEMLGAAPRRLFRRAFLLENRLRFPDEPLLEDSPFALQSHMVANTVSFSSVKPYHYRMNPQSMTWKRRSGLFNQYKHLFQVIENIINEVAIASRNDVNGQGYVSEDALRRRHRAWFIRFAAHSALIDSMSADYKVANTKRMAAVEAILDDSLVRRCIEESDLRNGSIADRTILFLIKHRITPLTAVFYYCYARKLSSASNLKR